LTAKLYKNTVKCTIANQKRSVLYPFLVKLTFGVSDRDRLKLDGTVQVFATKTQCFPHESQKLAKK